MPNVWCIQLPRHPISRSLVAIVALWWNPRLLTTWFRSPCHESLISRRFKSQKRWPWYIPWLLIDGDRWWWYQFINFISDTLSVFQWYFEWLTAICDRWFNDSMERQPRLQRVWFKTSHDVETILDVSSERPRWVKDRKVATATSKVEESEECQVGDQIFLKADTIYTIPRPQVPLIVLIF